MQYRQNHSRISKKEQSAHEAEMIRRAQKEEAERAFAEAFGTPAKKEEKTSPTPKKTPAKKPATTKAADKPVEKKAAEKKPTTKKPTKASKQASIEASASISKEASTSTPQEVQKEALNELPKEVPTEAFAEVTTEVPAQAVNDSSNDDFQLIPVENKPRRGAKPHKIRVKLSCRPKDGSGFNVQFEHTEETRNETEAVEAAIKAAVANGYNNIVILDVIR
jgi:hypothetical protein